MDWLLNVRLTSNNTPYCLQVEMVSSGATSTLPPAVSHQEPSESETHHQETTLSPERVRSIVGCDHSDLRLILNVAAVYYPGVLESVS